MSNVNITFPKSSKVNNNFTFADLHLDLTTSQLITNEAAKQTQLVDIAADYDLGAIRNSILNLFLTSPGDKILNPEFGMDLRDFIFQPLSPQIGALIKDVIERNIQRWEPRVKIKNVQVVPDYDNVQYVINMTISIPFLRVDNYILNLFLNSQGYAVFA